MIKCSTCNIEYEDTAKFCNECGQPLAYRSNQTDEANNSSFKYKGGYHEGNLNVEQEHDSSGNAMTNTDIEAGYFTGNLDVKQKKTTPSQQTSAQIEQHTGPVVSRRFSPHDDTTTEKPVLNIIIKSTKGFKAGTITQAQISVTNLSPEPIRSLSIAVEGDLDNTLQARTVSIAQLFPSQKKDKSIFMLPLKPGDCLVNYSIKYQDDAGRSLDYSDLAVITVADRSAPQTSGSIQIINNTLKVGQIDGNIALQTDLSIPSEIRESSKLQNVSKFSKYRCCSCDGKLLENGDRCETCGTKLYWKCPNCLEKVTPEDFVCNDCGMQLHQIIRLRLKTLETPESSESLRSYLLIQKKDSKAKKNWSTTKRYLLVRNPNCFRFGKAISISDEKLYNDVILFVHCANEPNRSHWKKRGSKTQYNTDVISRRKMNIIYDKGVYYVHALGKNRKSGILLHSNFSANDSYPQELETGAAVPLHDGDCLTIMKKLKFIVNTIHYENNPHKTLSGLCLTRVPIDDANDTVFLCTGKENNLHQHKEVPDEEDMDFKSHQYFFSACYLFHDTLFIGGKSTEGLIIDWPSLEVNRFEIVKQDGELNIVDRKAQKQSPQLKIECC